MTTPEPSRTEERPLGPGVLHALRYYLGGPRKLVLLAASATAASLAWNWSWLVAIGVAPLLLAALPCAAMCALGLCMYRMGGKSCPSGRAPAENPPPARSADALEASGKGPVLPEPQREPAGDPTPRIIAGEPSPENLENQSVDERSF